MKHLLTTLMLAITLTACSNEDTPVAATANDSAGSAPASSEKSIYEKALASPTRLEGDVARDAGRKPDEVLAFLGIGPGDVVLDMFSGGGYYAEILSHVVGPDGRVVAQSNKAYLNFVGDEFNKRHADGRLPNVDILMAENNELELPAERFDAVTMILAYHDVYNSDPENGWDSIDVEKFLAEIYKSLKPGGIAGIADHVAAAGAPEETGGTLHRIDPALVIRDFEAAGFELDGQSNVLRNSNDDYAKVVFAPELRGKTDRFLMRFKKPE